MYFFNKINKILHESVKKFIRLYLYYKSKKNLENNSKK
jgi:hypothetical protein